jgi:hypothetical protein
MSTRRRTSPGFLSGAVSGLLAGHTPQPSEPEISEAEDDAITRRAIVRATLPRKLAELQHDVQGLRKQIVASKRRKSNVKNNPKKLAYYVDLVARKYPGERSAIFVAGQVDRILKQSGNSLSGVCPKSWRVSCPPASFKDACKDPRLKKRVKSFISRHL